MMEGKLRVSFLLVMLLLASTLVWVMDVGLVVAGGTIYIRADGSVDPPTAKIASADNVTYYFIGNNYDQVVVERSNIIVDGNGYTLQGNGAGRGFYLDGINNVTIQNTNIKNFSLGFYLYSSSNNTVSGSNITNNGGYSVYLFPFSKSSTVFGNNITDNSHGLYIESSSSNILRDNMMVNNEYSFGAWGSSPSHFVNDVDTSNTVDGKPVYYWINKQDIAVPPDAGYVALINCTRIAVQELNLTNNWQGALLASTTNSTITENDITNNGVGIHLYRSLNNSIFGNNVTNNTNFGVYLYSSSNLNTISSNKITNTTNGVYLYSSSNNNTVSGNNIANSTYGIYFYSYCNNNTVSRNNITSNTYSVYLKQRSSDNKFYHNNFIDNTQQVNITTPEYANFWDDGYPSGGNYWSDYTGVDFYSGLYQNETGSVGIGDTPYGIDDYNQDNYPLMSPYEYWSNPMLGDVNKDKKVGYEDLFQFVAAYGSTPGKPKWNPNCDFNRDYKSDAFDLFDLSKNYGKTDP